MKLSILRSGGLLLKAILLVGMFAAMSWGSQATLAACPCSTIHTDFYDQCGGSIVGVRDTNCVNCTDTQSGTHTNFFISYVNACCSDCGGCAPGQVGGTCS